jgi:hypothetical protein
MRRVTQRQHDAGDAERDPRRLPRQQAEVDKGIEQLSGIAPKEGVLKGTSRSQRAEKSSAWASRARSR